MDKMMQLPLPQLPLWVRIETGHDSMLEGVPELEAELEGNNVPVQFSAPWHPSCSTGLEFVFDWLVNMKLEDVIVQGMIFDCFKFAVKKIWGLLKSFYEKNKQADFTPIIIIRLDDVQIVFNGGDFNSIDDQTTILENLPLHIKELGRMGIYDIIKIEIPCLPTYLPDNTSEFDDMMVWRIEYGTQDSVLYLPDSRALI